MPLPQNVIEQSSREPKSTPGWAGQIIMFSGTVFFLSLVLYFGIAYGYTAYLRSTLTQLQDKVRVFSEKIPEADQQQLIAFYSQVSNLKTVLGAHVFPSPLFAWLEKNTEVNVSFNKLTLNVPKNQLVLGGSAKTMDDANRQFARFQSQPEVNRLVLSSLASVSGVWSFEATLFFVHGYFTSAPATGVGAASAGASVSSSSSAGANIATSSLP